MNIGDFINSSIYRPFLVRLLKVSKIDSFWFFLVFLPITQNALNTLSFFEKNTDAIGTNRGFYFQYLNTLKSWLDIYHNSSNANLFCETEDDLKKVGIDGNLNFTQFKCYSSKFSLSSKEVQKSFYNFYTLYYRHFNASPKFHFYSNSSITPSEDLLVRWDRFQDALRADHITEISTTLQPILEKLFKDFATAQKEVMDKKIKALEKKSFKIAKKEAERVSEVDDLKSQLADVDRELNDILSHISTNIANFISSIRFTFLSIAPDEANASLEQDCIVEIKKISGLKHTEKTFFGRLLTEIYKKSSSGKVLERLLDKQLLQFIIDESADNLKKNSDNRFEDILNQGFSDMKGSLQDLHIKFDNLNGTNDAAPGLLLSDYEEDRIQERITNEQQNDKAKNYQSNLERKINDINWKEEEDRNYLIQHATELRCRYAIYMEELNLSGQKREYGILRSLEKEIKTSCIHAVEKFGIGDNFDAKAFWADFQENLKVKIKEFSKRSSLNLQEDFVFAQMYQIAAECQLKWVAKKVNSKDAK